MFIETASWNPVVHTSSFPVPGFRLRRRLRRDLAEARRARRRACSGSVRCSVVWVRGSAAFRTGVDQATSANAATSCSAVKVSGAALLELLGARTATRSISLSRPPRPLLSATAALCPETAPAHRSASNYLWAELMQRALGIDTLACPRCGDRLTLIALDPGGRGHSPHPRAPGPAGRSPVGAAWRSPPGLRLRPRRTTRLRRASHGSRMITRVPGTIRISTVRDLPSLPVVARAHDVPRGTASGRPGAPFRSMCSGCCGTTMKS